LQRPIGTPNYKHGSLKKLYNEAEGKIVFFYSIMAGASTAAQAQSKVVAQINNIRNDKGVCRVCLFDNAAGF
jgi:uncharacterized protein (DUF2141 family)